MARRWSRSIDRGDTWVFRLRAQGLADEEIAVSRSDLERSNWHFVIPAALAQQWKTAAYPSRLARVVDDRGHVPPRDPRHKGRHFDPRENRGRCPTRVDAPGQPEVRITAGSGSITVIGEARDDVVADGDADVHLAHDGAFEIASHRRSRSMTVRCPEGASVDGRLPLGLASSLWPAGRSAGDDA